MDCCRPRSAIVRSLACTTLLLPAAATSRSRSIGLPAVPRAMPLLLSTRATPSAPSICIAPLRAVVWSVMGSRFRGVGGGRSGESPSVGGVVGAVGDRLPIHDVVGRRETDPGIVDGGPSCATWVAAGADAVCGG